MRRLAVLAAALLALTSPIAGCCFGDFASGFQEGMNTELECQPLIDAVNQAAGAVLAVPMRDHTMTVKPPRS